MSDRARVLAERAGRHLVEGGFFATVTETGAPPSYYTPNYAAILTCAVCGLFYDPSPDGFYTAGCEGCTPPEHRA